MGPPPDTKAPDGPHTLKKLSVAERQQVMERANVWRPLNISSLDIVRGPALPASQRIPAQVACTFVYPDKPLGGMTPKFLCDLGKGDVVKVKYGEKNGEVYAEVAASRLLWALGFQSDVMYPTRVTCRNCPADPFAASGDDWQRGKPTAVSTKQFDPAVVERESGSAVEVPGYEGWAFPELDKIGSSAGGATRAQLDALKLLAVFIQHSDSKPGQQEIVCQEGRKQKDAKGNETCARGLAGDQGPGRFVRQGHQTQHQQDEARRLGRRGHLEGCEAVRRRYAEIIYGKSRGSEDRRSWPSLSGATIDGAQRQTDPRPLLGVAGREAG